MVNSMELYVKDRGEWRQWLIENHSTCEEIWLIYYKKPSGKPRIKYDDAVEEALCFGWIDGKIKRVNEDYYIQRFTPRRKGSRWSKYNIERVKRMTEKGLMTQSGLDAFKELVDNPSLAYDSRKDGEPDIPEDLIVILKQNEKAYKNFVNFPPSARRIYISWLNDCKREQTRVARIQKIIAFSENNTRPGMNM